VSTRGPGRGRDNGQATGVTGRLRLLWRAARPHAVDPGGLGEYAALLRRGGPATAARAHPDVAAHLAAGCAACQDDLRRLLVFLDAEAAGDW
jgi:hypothetical protein